jgi:hypothetical protein
MMNSEVHGEGWISVSINPQHEARAREIRHARDKQYGNIFAEEDGDERWVGDLGEMAFNSWLKHAGVPDARWIMDNAAGQPDFILPPDVPVGVKTVKRKVAPRLDYTAQITARHALEPISHFFFLTYEFQRRRMWLLGGIDRSRFLEEARYHGAGDQVHANYRIREGHEIYNIEIAKLTRPEAWLAQCTRAP